MNKTIVINQQSFLADTITSAYPQINYTQIFMASKGMLTTRYREILRLHYNELHDQCIYECQKLIEQNRHRISTGKSQFDE